MKAKIIYVLSGKGGVGKTTISLNIALGLHNKGFKIGLIDADIHGPNILEIMGERKINLKINQTKDIVPHIYKKNFSVVSIAGFVSNEQAVIWRGPMKHNAIKQLIKKTLWDDIDYLIIDLPPGTGDEHLSSFQIIEEKDKNAIIVSTPQKVSIADTIRTIDFCKKIRLNIAGLIENMSGELFGHGTIKKISENYNENYLGNISLNKEIVNLAEHGKNIYESDNKTIKEEFNNICDKILQI